MTHNSSSCFSLEMEKGMSPSSRLLDKSLKFNELILADQVVLIKSIKLNDVNSWWEKSRTHRSKRETQFPISSGIWPVNLFPCRSLQNKDHQKCIWELNRRKIAEEEERPFSNSYEYLHRLKVFQISNSRRNFSTQVKIWQIPSSNKKPSRQ